MAYPPLNEPVVGRDGRVTVPWRRYFEEIGGSLVPGGGNITQLTGDVTTPAGGGVVPATLSATGVAPGTYGDATHVGQFTVDAKGRLSFAQDVLITGAGGMVCSPLTDGDLTEPELIFDGAGDCIMVCV